MTDYLFHYIESNTLCLLIFATMLINNILKMDRQEKQIKFNHALIAFMLYFISDIIWAMIIEGVIPKTAFSVSLVNTVNCILMSAITYTWLRYAMVVELNPNREKKSTQLLLLLPFLISTLLFIILLIINPHILFSDDYEPKLLYRLFLILVPIIYIVFGLVHSFKKAKEEVSKKKKRTYIYVGIYPLIVVGGGLLQLIVFPGSTLFCLCCTLFMIIFYVKSVELQISIDPLTGLNNRGQLDRYISSNGKKEGIRTFVIMIDVNDFKMINDTYGHAEGDRALVILSKTLKEVTDRKKIPLFLGRYGGDEFIIIAHHHDEELIKELIDDIRNTLKKECIDSNARYILTVGIGYDELIGDSDSYDKCIQRADHKLYIDKDYCKINGENTTINK